MLKRTFDFICSLGGLIILSPFLMAIAAIIKFDSPGPVFFRGARAGRYGNSFRLYKFRTMVVNAENQGGHSTPDDDPRLTRSGKFLRRVKLDELPQLINVLNGEMSIVGPRPQVSWAVENYTSEERILLTVRPGITDPASIKFHNEGEILRGSDDPDKLYMEVIHPEKMRLSMKYVRSRSLILDIKIIFQTLKSIIT